MPSSQYPFLWKEIEVLETFQSIFENISVKHDHLHASPPLPIPNVTTSASAPSTSPPSSGNLGNVLLSGESAVTHGLDEAQFEDLLIEFQATLFTHKEPQTVVLITLYIPLFVVAFFGNILVLFVVLPNRHMRSITNYFIVNLTLADLLVTLVCVPMAIGQSVYKLWVYGEFMCKFTAYLQGVTVAASVFTIMGLSLDRLLAIRHPMMFRVLSSPRQVAFSILLIWVVALLIMIPLLVVRTVSTLELPSPGVANSTLKFCNEIWAVERTRQYYGLLLSVFMFAMPGSFVAASYTLIGCQLWTQSGELFRADSNVGRQQAARLMGGRRRVARVLIVLAILFALCWMPYHLLSLYLDFVPADSTALSLLPFSIFVGHFNSALNPLLYCFINQNFRKSAMNLFKFKYKTGRSSKQREMPVKLVVRYQRENEDVKTSLKISKQRLTSSSGSLHFRSSRGGSGRTGITSGGSSFRSLSSQRRHAPERRISQMAVMEKYPKVTYTVPTDSDTDKDADIVSAKDSREMFNLMIPTTIDEESSRGTRSPSPMPGYARSLVKFCEADIDHLTHTHGDDTHSPSASDTSDDDIVGSTFKPMEQIKIYHSVDDISQIKRDMEDTLQTKSKLVRSTPVLNVSVSTESSSGISRKDIIDITIHVPAGAQLDSK